jgi:plasmid stabilization system protein ParE
VSFAVRYSASAKDDLARLYEYLLDRATTVEDLDLAERALGAITEAVASLKRSPFIYRKADDDPFLRELLIPFGSSGYVALFEIKDAATVTILAVRHQLEDDYH